MAPPEKSPGKSGVDDLYITRLSIKDEGMISNENAFLSGSVLGSTELFNNEVLYPRSIL